jgi:hypothetical protein
LIFFSIAVFVRYFCEVNGGSDCGGLSNVVMMAFTMLHIMAMDYAGELD